MQQIQISPQITWTVAEPEPPQEPEWTFPAYTPDTRAQTFPASFPERAQRLKRLLNITGPVTITQVETMGWCERISYVVHDDPDILLCWKPNAVKLNEKLAEFQIMRESASRLRTEGREFWNGVILPQLILTDLNRAQFECVKAWVWDVLDNCRTVPSHSYRRTVHQYDHPWDILGVR